MKKITLDIIAKEFNVSKNTVSKALRGLPGVSEELKRNITQYAENINYMKNSNTTRSKNTINISLVSRETFFNESSFWAQVFYGILHFSGVTNVVIRTIAIDETKETDAATFNSITNTHCNGYIVAGTINNELLNKIKETNIPLVVIDHYCDDIECDYINSNNKKGIYNVVQHLHQNNHKKIGFINNNEGAYSFTQRYEAYIEYMTLFGLEIDEQYIWHDAPYQQFDYYAYKVKSLCNKTDAPTAWICVNDITAIMYSEALRESGYNVPEDVSIIGFDNISMLPISTFTTIEVPQKTMGVRAVRQLLYRIENPNEPYENILMNTQLIKRSSVKKLQP